MSVKFVEATNDENGKARGGLPGDQRQKSGSAKEEVGINPWYNRMGGWDVCLECTDSRMASDAAGYAVRIAKDSSFGYDQDQRTTALTAIRAAGGNIEAAADSELDCSALVFICYMLAGLPVSIGYTGNLESRFLATGKFIAHREPKYTQSGNLAKKGWIYLTAGKHTAIIVEDDSDSVIDEEIDPENDPFVVDTQKNVMILGGSVYVRPTAGTEKKAIYTAHRGELLPLLRIDSATGWYYVETPKGMGYISCKPNLTKVV